MAKNLIEKLNKAAGDAIAISGDETEKVTVIPTGVIPLDLALGIGGLPRGRITDIYGLPSVGKSTICFTLIAKAQRMGIQCAVVDAENSYTKEYAEDFGVDTAKLIVVIPTCLEQGAEAIETLSKEGVGLIIVDSISSMVPRALAEAEHGKPPMGAQARGISSMLLKIVPVVAKHKTCLVCINQMRINIMATGYMDKYTVTGGWALKFYSSIRIEMKKKQAINLKDEQIGYIVGFKIVKNKLSRPNVECEVPYIYGKGFDPNGDIVQMAIERGIFEQRGAWVYHGDTRWQGKQKAEEAILADSTLHQELIEILYPQ